MKISPVPSLGNTVAGVEGQGPRTESLRSIKMTTDATPGAAGPQEMSISDDNRDNTNSVVEATQPISPQFAALAKERRAIQRERQLLEQQKAEQAAKSQGSDAVPLARLKTETLKVLQEAGVSYDDLTAAILSDQGNPEMRAMQAKIDALEKGIDQKFSEQTTQSEKQVLAEMQREASRLTNTGDEYELIRETRSVPDVMRLIELTYRETGEVLEVTEALKLVEDELFNRNQKLLGLKKMQALFPQQAPAPQPRTQGMRTLTNKDTASVPTSARARALAAFYGTLKK